MYNTVFDLVNVLATPLGMLLQPPEVGEKSFG